MWRIWENFQTDVSQQPSKMDVRVTDVVSQFVLPEIEKAPANFTHLRRTNTKEMRTRHFNLVVRWLNQAVGRSDDASR